MSPPRIGFADSALPSEEGERGTLAATLLPDTVFGLDGKSDEARRWLDAEEHATAHDHAHGHHHHHDVSRHDERIRSVSLTAEAPLPEASLDMFLGLVRESFGPKILRLKGIVDVLGSPGQPVVVQGVQHVVHVPAVLPAWPDGDRRSRIVLIVEDVSRDAIERLWNAVTGRVGVDQADLAAIADNPLAPATMAR